MPAFIDDRGQEWPVNFTIGIARRLRIDYVHGIDLFDPLDLQMLMDDPTLAYGVLWQAVRHVAAERGVSEDDFDESIAAEGTMILAMKTLYEAIADFSQRHREMTVATMAKIAAEKLRQSMDGRSFPSAKRSYRSISTGSHSPKRSPCGTSG